MGRTITSDRMIKTYPRPETEKPSFEEFISPRRTMAAVPSDEEIRLRCLEIAQRSHPTWDSDSIKEVATELERYVRGEEQ